jgi:dolichyl-phosphate beta-glucosyltransferase
MTASEGAPHLSLVVPAFNEEHRIEESLRRIGAFLLTLPYSAEVVVVDDGSTGAGRVAAQAGVDALPPELQRQLLRHETNRGKGAAVRTGALAARGRYTAFIDADLATPPEELPAIVAALEAGADVAIGVRTQRDGSDMRDQRRLARRMAGRLFAWSMRRLLLPDIGDSQCPLKGFTRDAAQQLFPLQQIDTWSFDAELLFLARKLKMTIAKIPVHWRAVPGSHLRLNLNSARELYNLVRIRYNHRDVTPGQAAS